MRRALPALCLGLLSPILLSLTVLNVPHAAARTRPIPAATSTPSQAPPHAWLFGAWSGGLFPVLADDVAEDCRTQQTVLFAKDTVAHGSLTGSQMTQRVIETVRTTPQGAVFRFTPQPGDAGFGCPDPDGLPVLRDGPDGSRFPDCKLFPYPLTRCSGR